MQNISSPLNLINNDSQLSGIQDLRRAFNDLKNNSLRVGPEIYSMSNSNPNPSERGLSLLTTLSDDIRVFNEVYNKTIEPTRAKFFNDIQLQINRQDSELKKLDGTKMLLFKERNNSIADRGRIEARLNQTQFPFGPLPVNLDESIPAFPVALGIGFILSASYLVNSIHLRKELHSQYQKKYKEGNKENIEHRISLIASLWVDPAKSRTSRTVKFFIFIIPFLIFLLSCYLAFYYIVFREENQILSSLFSYGSFNSAWAYGGIYLLCAGLFIYGILNTLMAIRRY